MVGCKMMASLTSLSGRTPEKAAKDKEKVQADKMHQQLEERSILITVDEQDLFDEHASMLQNHPKYREAVYTKMLEDMGQQMKTNPQAIGKIVERARQRIRAKEAKRPLHSDYLKKVSQYIKEGTSRLELFDRLTLKAKKRKNRQGEGRMANKGAYKKAAAMGKGILAKAKKNCKKFLQRKKDGKKKGGIEDAEEFKQGPMVGKTVRVCEDPGRLANLLKNLCFHKDLYDLC